METKEQTAAPVETPCYAQMAANWDCPCGAHIALKENKGIVHLLAGGVLKIKCAKCGGICIVRIEYPKDIRKLVTIAKDVDLKAALRGARV